MPSGSAARRARRGTGPDANTVCRFRSGSVTITPTSRAAGTIRTASPTIRDTRSAASATARAGCGRAARRSTTAPSSSELRGICVSSTCELLPERTAARHGPRPRVRREWILRTGDSVDGGTLPMACPGCIESPLPYLRRRCRMPAAQADAVDAPERAGERVRPPRSAVRRVGPAARGPPAPRAATRRADHRLPAGGPQHRAPLRAPRRPFGRPRAGRDARADRGGRPVRAGPRLDFLSFAVPTITGEIRRHFRDRSRTIRIPRRIIQQQAGLYEAATSSPSTCAAHRGPASSPSTSASPARR